MSLGVEMLVGGGAAKVSAPRCDNLRAFKQKPRFAGLGHVEALDSND